MKKKLLLFTLLAAFFVIFLTGCGTSPFPKVTESGVVVQVLARGRPMENITVGVKVTNNTSNYIGDVTVRLDSIDGHQDLLPFQLWRSQQELNIQSISKSSTIDAGKDATFAFGITSYSYIEVKSYPMVIKTTYKDSNGKENLITQNSIVDLVTPNKFYKFMRDLIEGIHKVIPNYGFAIVALTIIIKLITHPLTKTQFKSTAKMQKIQPEIKKIQQKYKDNPQKANQEVMKIYKEHNINMFGGCLPLLVQWPLLFVLFGALNNYAPFNTSRFLWLSNINTPDPYYIMPVVVFLSMFLQSKTSQLPGVEMDSNTKMMTYFLPVIFAVWAIKWAPSILIYWITFSLIAVGEQTIILRGIRVAMEQPKGQSKSRIVEEELPQDKLPEQIGTHEQSQVTKEKKEKEVKPVKTKKNPRSKQEKK
jgi:YidC/Oxa1 family membrane protein insertase